MVSLNENQKKPHGRDLKEKRKNHQRKRRKPSSSNTGEETF